MDKKNIYFIIILAFLFSLAAFFLPLRFRIPIINIITCVTGFLASFAFFSIGFYSRKVYQKYYTTLFLLGLGLFFNGLGELAWLILEFLGKNPFPSIADVLYLSFYPIFGLGLLTIPVERKTEKIKSILDFCIISASLATIIWIFILKPIIVSGGPLIEVIISAGYVFGDFIILFIIVDAIINKIGSLRSRSVGMFLAGIIVLLLSDLLFAYSDFYGFYYSGCPLDLGWIISYLLLTVSTIEFRVEDFERPVYSQKRLQVLEHFPDFFLLFLFILFVFVLFNFKIATARSFAIAFFIILSLTIGRHHAALLENRKLIKRANAEKRKAELYLEIAAWAIILLDDKGRIQYINPRGLEILECAEEDVKGKNWFLNFIPADERPKREKRYLDHIKRGEKSYALTGSIITCKGNRKIIHFIARLLYEEGEFKGALITGEDITEVYHMSRKLEESEKRYMSIFKAAPNIIISLDEDFTIQDCNSMVKILGYKPHELKGKSFNDILEDKIARPIPGEYRIRRRDKSILYAKINFSRLKDEIITIIEDITPLKEYIKERELLLREIHHRVKNNLQIISSLLGIQERKIEDPKSKGILSSSRDRIKSISLLHEHLYQSEDLAKVKIRDYIKNLTSMIIQTYTTDIRIETDIDDITLNIETSLPIGLIINELLTNTIKHANATRAKIQLKKEAGGGLRLHFRDDGKGLRMDEIKKSKGLGWQLIESLIDQLGGKLTIKSKKGLDFTVTFKELTYKKRY
ncbi:MAG: histidine kinase dimerization/phosphoacceptor domain -containing protein [Methanothermobacter sp.]|nr:histidine kinase dimerization/phosphoacceptor domain -containing protein [Methanothermobacter sp.]